MRGKLWDRVVRVVCVIAMVVSYLPLTAMPAYAASDYTGGADQSPAQYILNDHTAYAVHVTGSGLPASTVLGVSIKLSDTGISGGFGNAPGFTWNADLSRWVQSREAASNDATIATDGSGAASGWYYFKCGDEGFTGFPAGNGHGANQAYLTVQIQALGGGNSYNPTVKPIVTVLDARTQGAWVHDGVATGAASAKRAEALKSDDAAVSYSLQKTEANALDDETNGVVDDEDYGPAGATGDFRFGVPAGVTMNVKLNQVAWAPGQGVTAGPADTDIALGASDVSAPTAPVICMRPRATGREAWTGAPRPTRTSGLAGYDVYRLVPGTYGDLTLQTGVPRIVGSTVGDDRSPIPASRTGYSYYVRAKDNATNVGATLEPGGRHAGAARDRPAGRRDRSGRYGRDGRQRDAWLDRSRRRRQRRHRGLVRRQVLDQSDPRQRGLRRGHAGQRRARSQGRRQQRDLRCHRTCHRHSLLLRPEGIRRGGQRLGALEPRRGHPGGHPPARCRSTPTRPSRPRSP